MQNIFHIRSDFDFRAACLESFHFQYDNVGVYRRFVDHLNIRPGNVDQVEKIPFLPIEVFKNHLVLDAKFSPREYFQSSGTTNIQTRSKHYIADLNWYEQSIYHSFAQFIGKPEDYIVLGLLPNYSENPHSSLIYMVDFLMKKSGHEKNGYFLYNHQELVDLLNANTEKKILLFGVSFALLDFLDFLSATNQQISAFLELTVIETGGMKGRKEEITKDLLLEILQKGFKSNRILSEYSMTELLSQAYSLGKNIYESPNWMRVIIRNTEDPFAFLDRGRTGGINIIDLANRHSCSFIATQDLGMLQQKSPAKSIHPAFSVVGRIDNSDIRGCSLLVS